MEQIEVVVYKLDILIKEDIYRGRNQHKTQYR